GLGADEAVALVSASRALQTLRLGEWVIPVGELRSSESVSTGGLAVGEAEGAVVGALLKASISLSTLDLSGSSCAAAALSRISEGLRASAAPLAELRLGRLIHGEGAASVAARLAVLVRCVCRPSLRLIDCTKQAGGKAGVCALFAAEGEGVVASLAALMSTAGNALATVRLGGNGAWAVGECRRAFASALGAASCVVAELDVSGSGLGADEAVALVSAGRALQTLRLGEWVMPVGELRSGESVSTGGLAVGEPDGAVVGALLKASTSLSTLDLSGSSCAAEAARLIGEGLRESAAPLAELRGSRTGACRLSLREVDCSAQAIEATEAAALERLALLFAPKLKVAHATLGDGGRSVRLEKDGRALLGAVSPMVELVVQQCTRPDYCYIGAALPGKGALSSFLGVDDESWGYTGDGVFRGDGRIKHKDSYVQSGLPTYKAGDRIRMTLAGGVRGVPSGVHFGVGREWDGAVEVRIERALVAGAAWCRAMLPPLCALIVREGNVLRTVRLGGNGAWAAGDGATLAAALGAASWCAPCDFATEPSGTWRFSSSTRAWYERLLPALNGRPLLSNWSNEALADPNLAGLRAPATSHWRPDALAGPNRPADLHGHELASLAGVAAVQLAVEGDISVASGLAASGAISGAPYTAAGVELLLLHMLTVLGASSLGAPQLNCMRQEHTTLKTTLISLRRVYPVSDALAPPETAALVDSARIPTFGRLRVVSSVEGLKVTQVEKPIVHSLADVSNTLQHACYCCTLLSNQHGLVHNSFALRLGLITHLFLRVLPHPLPLGGSVTREEGQELSLSCFWLRLGPGLTSDTQGAIIRPPHQGMRRTNGTLLEREREAHAALCRLLHLRGRERRGRACMASLAERLASSAR
ncbi:hypothetical protein Ctob_012102, partial [Chrysochromulina tobinii]